MCKATIRALSTALAFVALFTAGTAAAQMSRTVTTWSQNFKHLSKPSELAVGVNFPGAGFDLNLPADFTMRFDNTNIRLIRANGYGVIAFNSDFVTSSNQRLPYASGPRGFLAPFWEQWDRRSTDPFEGGIYYKVEGEGDKQVLKVEYKNFPYYYCYPYTGVYYGCDNMRHFSFQVWIYESNGVDDSLIQFHYAPINIPDGCYNGTCLNFYETYYGWNYLPYNDLSGTIGIQNVARNVGVYGLANCTNDCNMAKWPANQVIMFGQPKGVELLPSMSVRSMISDDVNTTLSTTTSLRNIGATAAVGVTFAYYLSADNNLDPATDTLFAEHDPVFDVLASSTVSYNDDFVKERPPPGWYYVCLFADSDEAAAEAFEDNNKACTNDKYIVGVDFTGSITVPPTAGPGDFMNVGLTITNVGYEDAGLEFRILLSEDEKPGDDDIELFRNQDPIVLAGQESYAESMDLEIPVDALDNDENEVPRFVLVQFDPDGLLLEADETNNVVVSEPVVLIKADLRVDNAVLEMPDGCYFGRPATISMDISNTGAARARAFDNALVISDNGVITSYDLPVRLSPAFCRENLDCSGTLGDGAYCNMDASVCTKDCVADADCVNDLGESEGLSCFRGACMNTIAGYDAASVTFSGNLPVTDANGAPLLDGIWFFGAVADFYDQVREGNEANNARPAASAVECYSPAPDFIATSLKIPAAGAGGEQLAIRREIKNRGNLDGSVAWKYYLSSNDIISDKDIELKFAPNGGGSVEGLEPEAVSEGTDIVLLPSSLAAGVYYLGIVIDPTEAVHELSDDNNLMLAPTTVDVKAAALRIATSALPPATVQVTYLRQLVATGGAGAYAWTATTPALPPGMRLQTDGVLTGKPVEEGAYVFGVRVQSGGAFADGLLYLAVLPATGPLTVSTDRLPAAYVDVTYRVELAAVGGTPPYAWSIVGRLPQGLSLKNNTITGVAEIADGTSEPRTFKVQVRDARGTVSERELSLAVLRSADLSIQTTRIQDGLVGQPYQQIIRAAGGEPPYEFSITGLERTGLTYNNNSDTTALISGIPDASGYFEMTVRVEDQSRQQATQTFKFAVIGQAIQVQVDRPLPVAVPGEEYQETQLIAASQDAHWEIFAGELPPGVDLSHEGVLSGMVDKAAPARTYTFLARAYDDNGGEGFGAFAILIEAAKLEAKYKESTTGCGASAAGGSASGLLLPVLGAALLLLRRRRS